MIDGLFWFFYFLGTRIYFIGIRILATIGHQGAWQRYKGSKSPVVILNETSPRKDVIWIHCASAGEFELIIPVIQQIKKQHPSFYLLVSFFSSSGYQYAMKKPISLVDAVCFLPDDSPWNACRWIKNWNPKLAIFAKHDYWGFYLKALKKNLVPTFLISATFSKKHKHWDVLYKYIFKNFNKIMVQDKFSLNLCENWKIPSVLTGDTRFDRVVQRYQEVHLKMNRSSKNSKESFPVCILGSIWPGDLKILHDVIIKYALDAIWLICPHKPDLKEMDSYYRKMGAIRIEDNSFHNITKPGIYIIQQIGVLFELYSRAHFAFIGGGYGKGVHNILEAAVWGIPVSSGFRIQNFPIYKDLVTAGLLNIIHNKEEFENFYRKNLKYSHEEFLKNSQKFFLQHYGASVKVFEEIKHYM